MFSGALLPETIELLVAAAFTGPSPLPQPGASSRCPKEGSCSSKLLQNSAVQKASQSALRHDVGSTKLR